MPSARLPFREKRTNQVQSPNPALLTVPLVQSSELISVEPSNPALSQTPSFPNLPALPQSQQTTPLSPHTHPTIPPSTASDFPQTPSTRTSPRSNPQAETTSSPLRSRTTAAKHSARCCLRTNSTAPPALAAARCDSPWRSLLLRRSRRR